MPNTNPIETLCAYPSVSEEEANFVHSRLRVNKGVQVYLREVMDFAETLPEEVRQTLYKNLAYICRLYPETANLEIYLQKDFAPYSFAWHIQDGLEDDPFYHVVSNGEASSSVHRRYLNGGIIFHGAHDGGGSGSAPTYSVCLTPTNGWAVQT